MLVVGIRLRCGPDEAARGVSAAPAMDVVYEPDPPATIFSFSF
jgi:hypothetical protein